jgi:ligand-binding sensor domain-containing protein
VIIVSLAINSQGHIFAGSATSGVYRSTNNGGNWQLIINGITNVQARALAINRNDHIFVGTAGGGIFRSTDNGDTWIATSLGLTFRQVISLSIDKQGHIFAGTEGGGIFRSIDNGGNWAPLNAGLSSLYVRALTVNANGYVFAGSLSAGVFRSAQPTTSVSEPAMNLPTDFFLAQNYPNPFNPSTTIVFALPRASRVTLKIFNRVGEEVATLVNQKLSAGQHEAHWEASGWASGVYFYRLQAEGFAQTKKLMLIK